MNLFGKLFGTKNDREIKRIAKTVEQINGFEAAVKSLSDEQIQAKTVEFRQQLEGGKSLDDILPEAFAVCREASVRVLGLRHYDVQMIGGIVLHEGRIAEMKTGEGKTLTATLPIYLNALIGKGCHVVTVNDYLASRDAEWMGKLYGFLGLSVGVIKHGLNDKERRNAYGSDITYGTANEFGFDYLRDNMKTELSRLVQRDYQFVIVDEVDSILIDEARTPLIISGPAETNTDLYGEVNAAIPGMQKDSDYIVDEKSRTVALTEDGISKLETRLRIPNLYDPSAIEHLHHVGQALKAHILFKKDVDYVVRDGQVIIVDEHTGRLMAGRRYSDGLHGALEAKEHVKVQHETQTLATITLQNFFRMYHKLSGMTGTADTEAVEFHKIYKLDVVVIPTNKPLIRDDAQDVVYRTAREKFIVIADEIGEAQKRGQPVLVGTVSVEKSELLASLLKKRNITHEILNAKNHGREAEIVANAGQSGSVTISTNMAGRGTDIVLGEGVREAGGLFVMGTERHESRRIDNQLRGRSGRQGDPGKTQFYLSLEDDLMRIFASDKLSAIMGRLGMEEGEAIISPMVTRAIARAQKRVEEQNFGSRKHLIEYDDVMNQQRQVVYSLRRQALEANKRLDFLPDAIFNVTLGALAEHSPEATDAGKWDFANASQVLSGLFHMPIDFKELDADEASLDALGQVAQEQVTAAYQAKLERVPDETKIKLECWVYLQVIDKAWKNHLQGMDSLKDSVSLRGYGQRDPLQEYKKEAFRMFATMMDRINEETASALVSVEVPEEAQIETPTQQEPDESQLQFKHPDAHAAPASNGVVPPQRAEPKDSELIYHGSQQGNSAAANNAPPVQTFKRDGDKVGRNDPCPCGSGKKYKKCHGKAGTEELGAEQ
jgi:preprotein translocase subunit SecA